tara:strand:+ start:2396 stop:2599 length:204 start_codon:yes stop_codon:yes gene_type:complete
MSDDHLVAIETKLSFQEDLLDQLNSIIIKQQKDIDSLKCEFLLIQKKITSMSESIENAGIDERPPHY